MVSFFRERDYLAQSIHYHSVGMVIALELHVHVYMDISFEVSIH